MENGEKETGRRRKEEQKKGGRDEMYTTAPLRQIQLEEQWLIHFNEK